MSKDVKYIKDECFRLNKTQRSIRNYLEQLIDKADIDKTIDAAIWASSEKNRQPRKLK